MAEAKVMSVAPGEALDPLALGEEGEGISSKSPMPPAEPGHDVAKAREGQVFDPNAARRFANDEWPWLQDSEAVSPAHWPTVASATSVEQDVVHIERQIQKLQNELKELKKADKG